MPKLPSCIRFDHSSLQCNPSARLLLLPPECAATFGQLEACIVVRKGHTYYTQQCFMSSEVVHLRCLQEVKEMSQALGETAATVEGAADDSSRRRSRSSRSGARLSGRSARGRSASMYGRESDDEDSYDDEDDEYACGHSHRKSSLHKPRRSRAAHQKEADLAKYTEDPNDEELPEGVVTHRETISSSPIRSDHIENLSDLSKCVDWVLQITPFT